MLIIVGGILWHTLSIVKIARDADYSNSEPQSLPIPVRPNAPTTPLKLTKAANSITVTNAGSYSGCEFSTDGTTWSNTGAFTGLTAGTAYTVQVRVKATASTFKSASMTQAVTTVAADGSTTVKPGESVETGGGTTITNDGEKTTITDGGTTTTVTPPSGGGDVSVGTGGVTVPGGSTVKTGDDGPEIAVGDKGGTIGGDGEITIPGGGKVKPKEDGTVEVPDGTDGGSEIIVGPGNSGTIGGDGGVTVPGGGKVTVKDDSGDITITLPSGGGTVKPNPDGTIPLPGGAKVEQGGQEITVPDSGGTYHPENGTVTKDVCTVIFDSQGGSAVSSIIVTLGEKVTKPSNPTKSGYTFDGWYKERSCTTAWNFDTDIVTGNITLYAKWTETSNPGGNGGGGWYNPPTTYSVTIPTTAHGKVAVSPASASRGTTVTITAVPEDGYRLSSINVTSGGKSVPLTEKGNGKYTFTMPTGTVKVEAVFVLAETPETP